MEAWTTEALGVWLRELREAAGLSQDALGERVGRTRQQLIDYEKGRRDPGATTLLTMLDVLEVRLSPPPTGEPPPTLRQVRQDIAELVEQLRNRDDTLSGTLGQLRDQLSQLPREQEPRSPS